PGGVAWAGHEIDGDLPVRALHTEIARILFRERPGLTVEPPAPDHDVHAEPGRPPDHLPADAADTQQRQRQPVETARARVLLLVPDAGAQVRHVLRNAAIEGRISAKASSATAMAFFPGQLDT